MAYAFYYDAPGTREIYELVSQEIGDEQPPGLIVQLVTKTDTGLRHLNVWQTSEQWEDFRDARVRPAVSTTLTRLGIVPPAESPQEYPLEIIDISVDA